MFTGIVEGVGKVVSFEEKKAAWLLKLQAPEFIAETLSDGDSLACNGCCLTLIISALFWGPALMRRGELIP